MSLKKITPGTIALFVAALLILAVGTYTDNGGFQLAGGLVLVGAISLALSQAKKRSG